MASLVSRIEISDGVPDISIPRGYSGLMALVTCEGMPLGDIRLRVCSDKITSDYLTERIAERFGPRIVELCLEAKLNGTGTDAQPTFSTTVIVPTSGRPEYIQRCLRSVSELKYPNRAVLVVDNSDGCEQVRDLAKEHGARYVREKKRGLDFARNAGLHAASSDLVAYVDDDAVVDQAWLDWIAKAFQEDTAIACVTGLVMPCELETPAQELFESYADGGMRRGYCPRVFDRFSINPLTAGKIGVGANMAFRASVLGTIGGFDEALDCGTPAKAGGEVDLLYRLLHSGFKVCYEPRALVWHSHRREMDELRRQLSDYSTAVYAFLTKCMLEYHDIGALRVGLRWIKGHHVKNLVRGMVGKGRQPWSLTVAEVKGALQGPTAYLKAKSYVSHLRQLDGSERRGRLNRGKADAPAESRFDRRMSAILAHLTGSGGRRRDVQCRSAHA
jgi:GT2 family glycosyltransferase